MAGNYEAARAALYALVPRGMVLGLETIRATLAARGNPQLAIPAVHIAGTNGKGSVAAMVDAALRASGERVGLYTSPHLHAFNERIRIDGIPADITQVRDAIWTLLEAMDRGELPALTFFEAATAVAWDVFAAERVDRVVLEVGLGGRLDATNVCAPVITAITRIAMDHESKLGNTLAAIAREKAGILKPGIACVLGPDLESGEARDAIEAAAREIGAPLVQAPRARVIALADDLRARVEVDASGGALTLDLALGGAHQAGNAAVAVGVLEHIGIGRDEIVSGLEQVQWPARMERLGNLLLDAAHNPDGAVALAAALRRLNVAKEHSALVFGASGDKDWRTMLDILGPHFDPVRRFYCAAALRRAEEPRVFAAHAGGTECSSVPDALDRARASIASDGLIVVCGSIFVVAEARATVLGIESEPPVAL